MQAEEHAGPANTRDEGDQVYGSFALCGSEFALSAKSIQEVVNEPHGYNPLPLAPDYILGLFNLRGTIIPVVDLQRLLNLSGTSTVKAGEKKVAIIEDGRHCVGLLFDRTGEIFNENDHDRSDFSNFGSEYQEVVVQGAFKVDGGKRIIQIIDPLGILGLKYLPHSESSKEIHSRRLETGMRKQAISFMVGEARCAFDISAIQEILKFEYVLDTALAVDCCIGAIELRGNTVPIVDFAALLKYREPRRTDEEMDDRLRVIVIQLGSFYFGLMVDAVESIVTYFEADVIGFPSIGSNKEGLFKGCIVSKSSDDILLINQQSVLSDGEIKRITHDHSSIYNKVVVDRSVKDSAKEKKTFVTFSLEHTYAIEMIEVQEVIDYPKAIIRPPNIAAHFKGVLNLRGGLVVIIDTRVLYCLPANEQPETSKVLVFDYNGVKYGLVIDSIDSIISFSSSDISKIPDSLCRNIKGSMSDDVQETIQIEGDDGNLDTLMILNMKSVFSRVEMDMVA